MRNNVCCQNISRFITSKELCAPIWHKFGRMVYVHKVWITYPFHCRHLRVINSSFSPTLADLHQKEPAKVGRMPLSLAAPSGGQCAHVSGGHLIKRCVGSRRNTLRSYLQLSYPHSYNKKNYIIILHSGWSWINSLVLSWLVCRTFFLNLRRSFPSLSICWNWNDGRSGIDMLSSAPI